jgi:hypothetical protein
LQYPSFQASLSHIKEGKLFPQLNYYDQSHFIKEIKKFSGVSPKELFKNQNDRFYNFWYRYKIVLQHIFMTMLLQNKRSPSWAQVPGTYPAKLLQLKGANVKLYERDFDKTCPCAGLAA